MNFFQDPKTLTWQISWNSLNLSSYFEFYSQERDNLMRKKKSNQAKNRSGSPSGSLEENLIVHKKK